LRLDNNSNAVSERALWWELSSCVLSSRVPYELATVAADALDHTRVLLDHRGHDRLEERIFDILSKPLSVKGRMRKYRFPAAKAAQLALTHQRIHSEATGLSKLIAGFEVAEDARQWLVDNAPGLGPKQASMFLRNVGVSYDLAVLDSHVLQYMELIDLRMPRGRSVHSMLSYVDTEVSLRDHAVDTMCPVGILDWAIWIVMRVIKQPREKVA
jgi:N-glycosylase/DNA lyase